MPNGVNDLLQLLRLLHRAMRNDVAEFDIDRSGRLWLFLLLVFALDLGYGLRLDLVRRLDLQVEVRQIGPHALESEPIF